MKAIAKILIAGLLFGRLSMVTPLSLAAATFSDANWISMGGIPGANDQVYAAIVDGSGNLYIGGPFTGVGDTVATYVAKWNGSGWSALGSGIGGGDGVYPTAVQALAVAGSDLYAGGNFARAVGREASSGGK